MYVDGNTEVDSQLTEFCDRFCMSNTITEPTRVTNNFASLIDVILTSNPERFALSGTKKLPTKCAPQQNIQLLEEGRLIADNTEVANVINTLQTVFLRTYQLCVRVTLLTMLVSMKSDGDISASISPFPALKWAISRIF